MAGGRVPDVSHRRERSLSIRWAWYARRQRLFRRMEASCRIRDGRSSMAGPEEEDEPLPMRLAARTRTVSSSVWELISCSAARTQSSL
jgi:hypothetical protein